MGERINQKTCDILQNHESEPLDKKTCEKLDAIIEKAERREANK
jgi:trimethylamine--corrinoid protein Co-methyltransferase